ncbi:MAG: prepilin-type N-terminal cleavage/methylation domain-containing protein [Candidatus Falkowbacteria bacterium]|nr:prepilin-type N-terminal cleavage/methylation domain-containing protein [Candidatus Falkowbacteria bacterium]
MLNKQKILNNLSGFSLVELLVYLGIFMILGTMAMDYIVQGFKSTTFSQEQEEAINEARKGTELTSKEIRGANNSDNGYYPLATTTEQELVFYSDINDDNSMERIRYYLNGTRLMREETASGPTHNYSQTPTVTEVAKYINNQTEPLFVYYDRNNVETELINNIHLIEIIIKVNVTPWRAPDDYYVITDVNLRNLKDNL